MTGDQSSIRIFSHARFAFKYGLIALGLKPGDSILVPEYNCDVIYHPLRQMGINIVFYTMDDWFQPDWNSLNKNILSTTKGVLMVHFFGQPQPILKFKEFCKLNNLFLFEDNAHGHGGKLNGQPLGTFGDVGFSSPRKYLGSSYGACLYINGKESFPDINTFPLVESKNINRYYRSLIRLLPSRLKLYIKTSLSVVPDYSNPFAFIEEELFTSTVLIGKCNKNTDDVWNALAARRRAAWIVKAKWARQHDLIPIADEPHPESCPWLLPMYAKSTSIRNEILLKNWDMRWGLAPWPSLPIEVLNKQGVAFDRWNRFVCSYLDE